MSRQIPAFVATALAILAFPLMSNAAMAQSYSGSWPVIANLLPQFAHTACLALVDSGKNGQHSGSALLSGPMVGSTTLTGTSQVINHLLVATIESGSDTGEVVYLLFITPAAEGDLGKV